MSKIPNPERLRCERCGRKLKPEDHPLIEAGIFPQMCVTCWVKDIDEREEEEE